MYCGFYLITGILLNILNNSGLWNPQSGRGLKNSLVLILVLTVKKKMRAERLNGIIVVVNVILRFILLWKVRTLDVNSIFIKSLSEFGISIWHIVNFYLILTSKYKYTLGHEFLYSTVFIRCC